MLFFRIVLWPVDKRTMMKLSSGGIQMKRQQLEAICVNVNIDREVDTSFYKNEGKYDVTASDCIIKE